MRSGRQGLLGISEFLEDLKVGSSVPKYVLIAFRIPGFDYSVVEVTIGTLWVAWDHQTYGAEHRQKEAAEAQGGRLERIERWVLPPQVRPNDVQTTTLNPSLHKPAQQAGAAQVINAPPNRPQGSYHTGRALNNSDINLPPFPQHLEQAQRIAKASISLLL